MTIPILCWLLNTLKLFLWNKHSVAQWTCRSAYLLPSRWWLTFKLRGLSGKFIHHFFFSLRNCQSLNFSHSTHSFITSWAMSYYEYCVLIGVLCCILKKVIILIVAYVYATHNLYKYVFTCNMFVLYAHNFPQVMVCERHIMYRHFIEVAKNAT